mgnify:CR=1 FL=1
MRGVPTDIGTIHFVGIGGIGSMDDVLSFFVAGAAAVQVGTSLFARPALAGDFVRDLERRFEAEGLAKVADLRSSRLPGHPATTTG